MPFNLKRIDSKRDGKYFFRRFLILSGILSFLVCSIFGLTWNFGDSFVFLLVEESSSSALRMWPHLYEKSPDAIVDPGNKTLIFPRKKSLFGVGLCVYHLAISQGVQIDDRLYLSHTGREHLDLDRPIILEALDPEGRLEQSVDNNGRVFLSDVEILKTHKDGRVELKYGNQKMVLAPGETYSQILVRTENGVKDIPAEKAPEMVDSYMAKGYSITRLTLFNCGVFSKGKVKVGEGS